VLNVFFRDVGQFFNIALSFWFWLTPIVYSIGILPPRVQTLIRFNPMTLVIEAFQVILVQKLWPNWFSLWPVVVLAILLCLVGFNLFRKHSGEMMDEL
jgi:lipopolysaccharide transport system permease protein